MTLSKYLIFMSVAATLCWSVFALVVNIVDPFVTNWLGFLLFYVSLYLAITATASVVGFLVRFVVLHHSLAFYAVSAAVRQSFLISTLVVSALILLSFNMLSWLNILLLIFALSILEYLMLGASTQRLKPTIPIDYKKDDASKEQEFINKDIQLNI